MPADTIDLESPVSQPDTGDLPVGLYRPVLPARGLGARLRGFIGVREDILDWVPEERARYTRLGAIVLNTGLMAALSLLVALTSITSVLWVFLIPAALVWGYVIVSFDGWLIAGTHGLVNAAKLRIFIPRLAISVLMGAVIAEPLLLWVFQPAIHKEVLDNRQQEITAYTGQLTLCNPASGDVVATPACGDFHVNVAESPKSVQEQLDKTLASRDQLRAQVDEASSHLAGMEATATNECAGTKGPGLTGVIGDGAECKYDWNAANQYRVDSQLDQRQHDLTGLTNQVTALTANLAQAKTDYGRHVADAIAAQVRQKAADQGDIGILDEEKALETLSGRNFAVFAAQWLVRLLLIAIDCLPALAKMMSSSTTYDELLSHQLETARNLRHRYVSMRERRDSADNEVRVRHTEYGLHAKLERINEIDRLDRAQREADKQAHIEALAAKLRARQS
ncbi:DUF4407 domain-containing protein [Kutzneria sp. CA-103260]|uniref:DUF4407 domain-containing protein n=1 Tax=Kutzneria sp. CA-103260 TaxID=2802641 RepID=UPI001BEFC9D4|nr:DUF4407 domain-containing protein [Kutzneria sp. CA-103260]QUQ69491.1 hypothetical protein JJ691_72490 [Kutzneria sp. CA-103260]